MSTRPDQGQDEVGLALHGDVLDLLHGVLGDLIPASPAHSAPPIPTQQRQLGASHRGQGPSSWRARRRSRSTSSCARQGARKSASAKSSPARLGSWTRALFTPLAAGGCDAPRHRPHGPPGAPKGLKSAPRPSPWHPGSLVPPASTQLFPGTWLARVRAPLSSGSRRTGRSGTEGEESSFEGGQGLPRPKSASDLWFCHSPPSSRLTRTCAVHGPPEDLSGGLLVSFLSHHLPRNDLRLSPITYRNRCRREGRAGPGDDATGHSDPSGTTGAHQSVSLQSISVRPAATSAWFTRLKGLLPRNVW